MTIREQKARDMLQNIAKDIQAKLPPKFGFTLLAYEFGIIKVENYYTFQMEIGKMFKKQC